MARSLVELTTRDMQEEGGHVMTTATGRRFTSAERAGIRYLAQSPQYGPFVSIGPRRHDRDATCSPAAPLAGRWCGRRPATPAKLRTCGGVSPVIGCNRIS